MNSFAVEVWDDETEKVKFYSVRQENAKYLEVDRFLLRMGAVPEMRRPLQELVYLIIESIGNTYGAQEALFNRFENDAKALPPSGTISVNEIKFKYDGFPLRLYCMALSEDIVILFNGGIKQSRSVQESKDIITVKFYEANQFARRIQTALNEYEIFIDGRTLKKYDDSLEIYL